MGQVHVYVFCTFLVTTNLIESKNKIKISAVLCLGCFLYWGNLKPDIVAAP